MPLQPKFNRFSTASPVLASFDFTDIANGVGFESYYCFVSETNTGEALGLTPQIIRSAINQIDLTLATSPNTIFKDFDLSQFNIPRTIKGTAIITGSLTWDRSDANQRGFLTVGLYKWDGSTETLLASDRTIEYGNLDQDDNYLLLLDVPETVFATGEILRLKFTATVTGTTGTPSSFSIGTDPTDRDGGTLKPASEDVTTVTRVDTPFKLDL